MSDSSQQQGSVELERYIAVSDVSPLPVDEGPMNSLGSLGGVGLNIPLNLEVEGDELDQYLRQAPPINQYPHVSGYNR